MKKLLYPLVFALTAFLILYSCSAEEEDTTPPPQVQQPNSSFLINYNNTFWKQNNPQNGNLSFYSPDPTPYDSYVWFVNDEHFVGFITNIDENQRAGDHRDQCFRWREGDFSGGEIVKIEITKNLGNELILKMGFNNEIGDYDYMEYRFEAHENGQLSAEIIYYPSNEKVNYTYVQEDISLNSLDLETFSGQCNKI